MTFRKRYADHSRSLQERNRRHKREQGGFLLVVLLQSTLCTVMIATAFVMSAVLGMTEIKTAYSELATGETDAVEVFSALGRAAGSKKDYQLREVIELILSQVFGQDDAPAGGMTQYQPDRMSLPGGITVVKPLTAAPMRDPLEGRITSPFGPRQNPVTGKSDWHSGVDIAVPEGTAVGAAWPGVVCFTGEDDIYGRFVTVDHGGFKTRYCHCSKISVEAGVRLRQGETVALSGNTGMSTGPHLHFELIIDGKCADPLAEQPRWCSLEDI